MYITPWTSIHVWYLMCHYRLVCTSPRISQKLRRQCTHPHQWMIINLAGRRHLLRSHNNFTGWYKGVRSRQVCPLPLHLPSPTSLCADRDAIIMPCCERESTVTSQEVPNNAITQQCYILAPRMAASTIMLQLLHNRKGDCAIISSGRGRGCCPGAVCWCALVCAASPAEFS